MFVDDEDNPKDLGAKILQRGPKAKNPRKLRRLERVPDDPPTRFRDKDFRLPESYLIRKQVPGTLSNC